MTKEGEVALVFEGILQLFFLKSQVDVWFLTGVDRWVWGYQGSIFTDMAVKGLIMIIYHIYAPANTT
jgi:hypothetical protein